MLERLFLNHQQEFEKALKKKETGSTHGIQERIKKEKNSGTKR